MERAVTRVRRSKMQPGQIFGVTDPWWPNERDALVVIDADTEVSLWTGLKHNWGYVVPSMAFEVIS